VPSGRAALRARGRDHVRELTGRAVAELRGAGLPASEARLLQRSGRARDSAGLTAAQRRTNLAGTFAPRRDLPPRPPDVVLVLVDDIVTSGATLTEAAAQLAGLAPASGPPVLAAVVAATPRPGSRRGGVAVARPGPGGHRGRLSGPGNGD
jgi:predicted amidophosphoribosyltransferase